MKCRFMLVICLHVTLIHTMPIKVQLLPIQYGIPPENPLLQNAFRQTLPNINNVMQLYNMYPQQPLVLLLPNMAPNAEVNDRYIKLNEEHQSSLKSHKGHIDENNNSIILDALPDSTEEDIKKPIVIMPNGARLSIGDIISYIPFLPIEINVPDTIGWIAGLFPTLPWFGRPGQMPENTNRLSNKGPMPLIILPAHMMQ